MSTSTTPLEQYLKEAAQWQKTEESLNGKIAYLEEQIEWFKRQVFGQKAEKFVDKKNEEQHCFEGFDKLASAPPEKKIIPAHERSKRTSNGKDKIVLPANLPIVSQFIDLPEEAKVCPKTGVSLVKIGEETTSKLAHKPGRV